MTLPLFTHALSSENDIVAARHKAKRIAELLCFDRQDATRIATAVSEIARNALSYGGSGSAAFAVDETGDANGMFVVEISDSGPGMADPESVMDGQRNGKGVVGARRLMDHFTIDSGPDQGTRVQMGKRLPAMIGADPARLREIADQIRSEQPADAYSTLREQSRELTQSLGDLRDRQSDLERLNRELADTNRGVVALYSELEDKAEQLRQASEVKSKFLSYMSHEFRTPLNSVLALSRMLLDRLDGDLTQEQERQVSYILQSAQTLTEMVNDLLDLAKVESGRIDTRAAEFSVADLLAGLRGALRPLAQRGSVDLTFMWPQDLPALVSDEAKVAQILRNFVSNALKFTQHGSVTVSVTYDPPRDRFTFAVVDTGIGIAPENLDLIFEEFTQIDGPLQRTSKGTGLGLPLSKKLAELLNGSVGVMSEPGKGSTFTLTLPRDAHGATGATRPMRLLVVDDEEPFRYIMRQIARSDSRFEIFEATNGRDGLALAREIAPDIILLDLQMPQLDGWGVLRERSRDPALAGIPVLVVSSQPMNDALRERLGSGVEMLPKDQITREEVLRRIARIDVSGSHVHGDAP